MEWTSDLEKDAVITLRDEISNTYEVDLNQMYVTGLSMGGYGTGDLAVNFPDKFAAIVPICKGYPPEKVGVIKGVPVWAFHKEKDEVVAVKSSKAVKD